MQNDNEVINIRDFMNHETRLSLLEKALINIEKGLDEIKYEIHDMRVEFKSDTSNLKTEMNSELKSLRTEMNSEFSSLRKEMKSDFRWILTIIGGLSAIMAHGFHWF